MSAACFMILQPCWGRNSRWIWGGPLRIPISSIVQARPVIDGLGRIGASAMHRAPQPEPEHVNTRGFSVPS